MTFALKLNRCTIPTRTYINTYHVDAVRPFTVRDVQKRAARYNGWSMKKRSEKTGQSYYVCVIV